MGILENRVAIITGGAKGIGKATAREFARQGASVVIWDQSPEGEAVIAEIGSGLFQQVAVNNKAEVEKATEQILDKFGKVDILINNAGITRDRSLLKMDQTEWMDVIDVNLTGVFNCVSSVAPIMKENGYGRIISASSIVGLRGGFGQTNYSATKAGVIAMTKTWSLELAKYGITVNAIAPGYIDTDMTRAIPSEVREQLTSQIPAGRVGKVEEVAKAYLFLASEDAAYINGACLTVDGGVSR